MVMTDLKQAMVQYSDGTNHKIGLADFHLVNTATDPTQLHSLSFIGHFDRMRRVPSTVRPGTMAPVNMRQTQR